MHEGYKCEAGEFLLRERAGGIFGEFDETATDGGNETAANFELVFPCSGNFTGQGGGSDDAVVRRVFGISSLAARVMHLDRALGEKIIRADVFQTLLVEFGNQFDAGDVARLRQGFGGLRLLAYDVSQQACLPTGAGAEVEDIVAWFGLQEFEHKCYRQGLGKSLALTDGQWRVDVGAAFQAFGNEMNAVDRFEGSDDVRGFENADI